MKISLPPNVPLRLARNRPRFGVTPCQTMRHRRPERSGVLPGQASRGGARMKALGIRLYPAVPRVPHRTRGLVPPDRGRTAGLRAAMGLGSCGGGGGVACGVARDAGGVATVRDQSGNQRNTCAEQVREPWRPNDSGSTTILGATFPASAFPAKLARKPSIPHPPTWTSASQGR